VAEAKQLKPFLTALVVCKEIDGQVYKTDDYSKPTIDNPAELVWHNYYLRVSVERVVIVDSRSGRILKSVDIAMGSRLHPVN
jgi:hypothetical protein